jgi:ribonuclease-3
MFQDLPLWERALSHCSLNQAGNNQRLELLGDAILGAVITEWLYHRYPEADEGFLAKERASFVCQDFLCLVAERLDIATHLRSAPRTLITEAMLADTVEACIGAFYLDAGWDTVRAWIEQGWTMLEATAGDRRLGEHPKSVLQSLAQLDGGSPPHYVFRQESATPPWFSATVTLGEHTATGAASNKKEASRQAALALLSMMEKGSDAKHTDS